MIVCGLMLAAPAHAETPTAALTPTQIVAAAPDADWVAIASDDLLVMDLVADGKGQPRQVVIQLMPAPFSQGWVGNVRKLAAAHWWDGLSINRVQDNFVAQWGDADGDDKAKARKLPDGLAAVPASKYDAFPSITELQRWTPWTSAENQRQLATLKQAAPTFPTIQKGESIDQAAPEIGAWIQGGGAVIAASRGDAYASDTGLYRGFSVGFTIGFGQKDPEPAFWPIHCYGAVGVGRDMPPDTGSGAELYAVIGTPPRQLDRNLAIIGRVISGMEHLSSLPRGTGDMGFYKTAAERTPILSVRLGSELPHPPHFQYLGTESASFARYADARANRRDAFYVTPAGGADICNVPVPIRRQP